jgi:hypothetical protein
MRSASRIWLVALADPARPGEKLPARPLRLEALMRVLEMADFHGVLPAAVANLARLRACHGAQEVVQNHHMPAGSDALLDDALEPACERLRHRATISMLLRRQVEEIGEAMRRRGTEGMLLKGAAFADRLYDEPSLRGFTDADLLVRQQDADVMDAVLQELGYQAREVRMKHGLGYAERSYRRDGISGGCVEVHWNLVNSPVTRRGVSVTLDDLRSDGDTIGDLRRPDPATTLLIACVHAATGHGFDRLQPLCDVMQAVRRFDKSVDADWLRETANRTGAAASLAMGLHLAGRVLGEQRCHATAECLELRNKGLLPRLLITPSVVVRGHAWRDSFRRQWFRRILGKRR